MPDLSGVDLLRHLGTMQVHIPSIVITGHGDVPMAVAAMKAGALDFIEKPYEAEFLMTAIDLAFSRLEEGNEAATRVNAAESKIGKLSPRERDVLKGLIEGRSNKIIAYELDISPRTVEIYRANLMEKLEVRSLSEALRIAFAAGMFPKN